MQAFLIEITAKVIFRSDTDPNELPADLYSRIAEHIGNDDDILEMLHSTHVNHKTSSNEGFSCD